MPKFNLGGLPPLRGQQPGHYGTMTQNERMASINKLYQPNSGSPYHIFGQSYITPESLSFAKNRWMDVNASSMSGQRQQALASANTQGKDFFHDYEQESGKHVNNANWLTNLAAGKNTARFRRKFEDTDFWDKGKGVLQQFSKVSSLDPEAAWQRVASGYNVMDINQIRDLAKRLMDERFGDTY